ncbi:MAG TPA: hypothetical protein VM074_05555, partial [Solimonas sp.]|nr:hypothetical protein [Solimonas sp.]
MAAMRRVDAPTAAMGRSYDTESMARGMRSPSGTAGESTYNSQSCSNRCQRMTYCCAIKVNDGLVFAGDTRTSAG